MFLGYLRSGLSLVVLSKLSNCQTLLSMRERRRVQRSFPLRAKPLAYFLPNTTTHSHIITISLHSHTPSSFIVRQFHTIKESPGHHPACCLHMDIAAAAAAVDSVFNSSDGLSDDDLYRSELQRNPNICARQVWSIIARQVEDRLESRRNARAAPVGDHLPIRGYYYPACEGSLPSGAIMHHHCARRSKEYRAGPLFY
jgi:hypothetical protein